MSRLTIFGLLSLLFGVLPVGAQTTLRADPARSEFRIELGKAGLLKALGDEHLIRVREYRCDVLFDEQAMQRSSVKLVVRSASLEVLDPRLSPEKRAEVQKKMQGPEVLDVARFPEIAFTSRGITAAGTNRFRVDGDLRIRDVTRPVTFEVALARGDTVASPVVTAPTVTGEARVKMSAFGIAPPSAGAGTVKVKDEMKISFRLALVPAH